MMKRTGRGQRRRSLSPSGLSGWITETLIEDHKILVIKPKTTILDQRSCGTLRHRTQEAIDQLADGIGITFDISEIEHFDSCGLGLIITIQRELSKRRKSFVLMIGSNTKAKEVLRLTRLGNNFQVAEEHHDAVGMHIQPEPAT